MKLRNLGPTLCVIAIAAGGVVWSGCGDGGSDTTGTVGDQVQQEVDEAQKKAEDAVDDKELDKTRKEAEDRIEEGRAKAEEGIEEAQEQAEKYLP
jgi:hypothetical protein